MTIIEIIGQCPHNRDISGSTRDFQTIKLRLGDAIGAEQCELVRPITKIVLLLESDSPTESDENIAKLPGNFGGARWNNDITNGLIK